MNFSNAVAEFHNKHMFSIDLPYPSTKLGVPVETYRTGIDESARQIEITITEMRTCSVKALDAFKRTNDYRFMRMHLILEECAETVQALCGTDEVELIDGIADLVYVLAGTAVTFNLPFEEAFEEVHKSNMTKNTAREREKCDVDDVRLRNKGKDYVPPNLREVLRQWRKRI